MVPVPLDTIVLPVLQVLLKMPVVLTMPILLRVREVVLP